MSGNVNPAAEANIYGDPDAANVVFSRMSNCWVLGLDVTHECTITKEQIDALIGTGKYGTFLHNITQFYLEYHRTMYKMEKIYVHDAAAFAAVVQPSLFNWHSGKVLVVADGPARGRTIIDECECSLLCSSDWRRCLF